MTPGTISYSTIIISRVEQQKKPVTPLNDGTGFLLPGLASV
jgi:hypothetical protein